MFYDHEPTCPAARSLGASACDDEEWFRSNPHAVQRRRGLTVAEADDLRTLCPARAGDELLIVRYARDSYAKTIVRLGFSFLDMPMGGGA